MEEIFFNVINEFDESPRASAYALGLAKSIIYHSDHQLVSKCIVELSLVSTGVTYDSNINPFSFMLHTVETSEALHSLLFIMNQIARGEGEMDGEGLGAYIRCAINLGLSNPTIAKIIHEDNS